MISGNKIIIVVLIIVTLGLSLSTGYFYTKSNALQGDLNLNLKSTDDEAATTSNLSTAQEEDETETTTEDTTNIETSSSDNRPSSPSDVVVVGEGETLFQISQKIGISYLNIAEVNGINPNTIKVGQTLIIPKNNQVNFTVNQEKSSSLQKVVDGGLSAFRLIALSTAKADASPVYGLTNTDTFTQEKIDEASGVATVVATKGDKMFSINLVQPLEKGKKGIWAIESIKPKTK